MTRSSWFKKIWNGSSKGVSTVVGTVFLMLIILMVAANVLVWTFSQNAQYNQEVMKRNQEEADSRNENVVASKGNYSVSGDEVTVQAELTNDGAMAAQIVNVWVLDTTTQRYGFIDGTESLNLNLNPGDSRTASAGVTISGASEGHTFNSWFVTARGNTIPLEEFANPKSTYPKIVMGALVLDFDRFQYFTYASENQLADYPDGVIGFDIPKQTYVAFGCWLTNVDPLNRTMIIDPHALFWQPGRPGVPEGAWFVINVNDEGTISQTYSAVTLKNGESKRLVFASQNDLGLATFKRLSTPNVVTTVATFLLIHGTLGSNPYAQSIPFVSLFYS